MTAWILGGLSILLFVGPRIAPKVIDWARSDGTSFSELLIAEAQALETLKGRADRRSAEKLSAAVEEVENSFMDGDEPR